MSIEIDDNTCKIPLRNKKGDIVNYTLIDKDNFERVNTYKWHIVSQKLKDSTYYKICGIIDNNIKILLSHFIMGKPKNSMVIDHINNNPLDNRKLNLREVTKSQNAQNKKKTTKETSSKYIGVCYSKTRNNWYSVCANINLGSYKDEIDAAKIYDKYVLVKYGENASTNNLIKYEEVKDLTLEDIKPSKIPSEFPKNISKINDNLFIVKMSYNKKNYSKCGKTLDEAKNILIELTNKIEKIKQDELEIHNKKEITKDKEGNSIINLYNNKKEIVDFTIVDENLWHSLTLYSWCLNNGYVSGIVNSKRIRLHRFLINDATDADVVDHINNNPLDNRLCNLRIVNTSENNHNKKKLKSVNNMIYKGVYKLKNSYNALISKDNITYNLGSFDTEIIAGIAYNLKATELYGDKATLNIINLDNGLYEEYKKIIIDKWNTIKYTGISFEQKATLNPYKVQLCKDGKKYSLGNYDILYKAVVAYNLKVIELFGTDSKKIHKIDINDETYEEYMLEILNKWESLKCGSTNTN
jgi:hypothetical protein